jgi:hypothetical protein
MNNRTKKLILFLFVVAVLSIGGGLIWLSLVK